MSLTASGRTGPAPDLVLILGADGTVLDAGSEALTRLSPGDAPAGLPLAMLVHPDDRRALAATLAAGSGAARVRLRDAEEEWRWFEVTSEPLIMHPESRLVRLVDPGSPAQLQQLEQKANQMQAVAGLAGRMAHEFNNLFTEIQGHLWRLAEATGDPERSSPEVEAMRRSLATAAGLTHQMLAYSRQQVLEPSVLDVNRVARDLVPAIRATLGDGIELAVLGDAEAACVRADRGQVEQILLAVIHNARDAMPDGGLLSLQVSEESIGPVQARRYSYPVASGRYVRITISDTGRGMDPEVMGKVFEPFFTTQSEQGKAGLGLSSTYGIVKQSGGYVWLESEPGVGTTVSIYLPRVDAELDDFERVPPLPGLRAAGPATILIVEDNSGVRAMVVKLLMRRGFSVMEASDGREALELAQSSTREIDLLLTDVMMPVMDGRELVRRLRGEHREMNVLYMSGYAQEASMRSEFIDAGDHFIAKPFEPEALLARVEEVLGVAAGATTVRPLR
jgi:two-component system, cell cycle sensor histidine kinase and response regulator CckA